MDYEFVLKGTMPLLMHKDDVLMSDVLNAWRKDPKNKTVSQAGDDRSPAWSWMSYLYHNSEHLAIPAECLMACLRGAGAKIPAKRGSFKSMSQSGLLITTDFCEFTNNGEQISMADIMKFKNSEFLDQIAEVQKLGFDLLIKRAKIGQSKHVRVRPMFKSWGVSGVVTVTEPAITHDILGSLFEIAGRLIGLGDWRPSSPSSPGSYGLFTADVNPVGEKQKRKAS